MKKSPYTRTTAELAYADLHPKFIGYLKKYTELYVLGDVEKEVRHCFVTTNRKKGLLGGNKTDYTVVCITAEFLFWGIISDKKETGIAAAKWGEIAEILDWEKSEMGRLMDDHGVEVLGFRYQDSHRSRWFMGLDDSAAGARCKALLKEMIVKK